MQNISWGGMPPDPPSEHASRALLLSPPDQLKFASYGPVLLQGPTSLRYMYYRDIGIGGDTGARAHLHFSEGSISWTITNAFEHEFGFAQFGQHWISRNCSVGRLSTYMTIC